MNTLFIKIYLSHFILERVMFVVYERWVGDKMGCYIDPSSPRDHSSISFSSWLGLLNCGSLRVAKPSVFKLVFYAGILSPTVSNCLGTWLYYCLTPTCFRCSSAYLHWCISWLTAQSRINLWHIAKVETI